MLVTSELFAENLKALPWWGVALLGLVSLFLFNSARYYLALYRSGAHLAPYKGDGYLGFLLIRQIIDARKTGNVVDFLLLRFKLLSLETLRFKIVGIPMISTKDPENIKAMLATQFNDFALGIRHKQFKIVLGDGIFTLDGAGWKHSRAMLRPQFAREQVGHVQSLEPLVQNLFSLIKETKGQAFDIQPLFFKLTIDSGTQFLFGETCDSLREDDPNFTSTDGLCPRVKREFPSSFNTSQSYLFSRGMLQSFYWIVNNQEFRTANKTVHRFTDHYVQKALNATPDEVEKITGDGYVFLYELAKQSRDPKVLRDQCLNILLAARDTTAGLMSFLFFELARNPEVFKKLREEIVMNFGEGEDVNLREITFESLKKCEYLKWVLNETLRMYPSVPQNFRVATKDTTLPHGGGADGMSPIFVPKGTNVTYTVFATQRLERLYGKDADVFRPERWGEPEVKKVGWGFLPFNGGPRICLGQQFALTEASYVTVRILQVFKTIISHDEKYPPAKLTHLTMSLFDGANISLL